ncbi:MAG: hypothetical protein PHU92_03470 [Candidatus Shapirobacteria bacterium]|nr:hypothetical protein [Candidatus Shapirobacteria bacterium]
MNRDILAIDIGEAFLIKRGSGDQGIGSKTQFSSIGELISTILPNVYVLAGIILLFFLIFGGLAVILGASKGNKEQVEKGKKVLTGTLVGFLVIFASYWIVQILEILTGVKIFN